MNDVSLPVREFFVNLDLPPSQRWVFLKEYKGEIFDLISCYLDDIKDADFIFNNIELFKRDVVSEEYLEEIDAISEIIGLTSNEILIANLYYDILKFYFGCTAFSVWTDNKILHARNLDWHTYNNLLSTCSGIFHYQKNNKTIFKVIGWLGFIGALSGIKPDAFSLTLNAVLSDETPQMAKPITFLLRDVLTSCNTYEEAKRMLEKTTIASDCLILISGIKKEEMSVIERTPTRFATRNTETNFIVVTNDYKLINNSKSSESVLQATSCNRYNKTESLLKSTEVLNSTNCLSILKNEEIMMNITVQQMVFENKSGLIILETTNQKWL